MSSDNFKYEENINRDSRIEDLLETIRKRIGNLNIEIRGGYSFKSYDGQRKGAREFIKQFLPYKDKWTTVETWAHIENSLSGKALNWFRGAKRRFFNTWEEFIIEFEEMFFAKDISEVSASLVKIRNMKVRKGSLWKPF